MELMNSSIVGRALEDPFDGFFLQKDNALVEKGDLLDFPPARRWLQSIHRHSTQDRYTYQQTLEGPCKAMAKLEGRDFWMLSSYDYLGLIGHPAIEAAAQEAIRQYSTGSGGVRLLTGTNELHRQMEWALAAFKGTEAAMSLSSGYMANLAAISALMDHRGQVLADSCVHRSILDACRIAKVPVRKFAHNDTDDLERLLRKCPEQQRVLIISEGVFSMDGDICPLRELVRLKEKYRAFLMIDEAHCFGYLGEDGSGVHRYFDLPADAVDIWSGSLSKTIPSNGGFLAGSRQLIYYLQHAAAPFFFSAALCPAATAAALSALQVIREEPERMEQLWRNAQRLRTIVQQAGHCVGNSQSPIVPLILGEDRRVHELARHLYNRDILTSAVVSPAVARGQARLRLCATAAQPPAALEALEKALKELA